jgi:hypothetical protein
VARDPGGRRRVIARENESMKVKKLLEVLKRFDPEASVRLCVSLPGRVIETHEELWVADYGGGPQINAASDFRGFHVYVGCGIEQFVRNIPERADFDLGQYDSPEIAARVRDFYIFHKELNEPLSDPEFDYESWIPPRTTSGEYNERIAEILKEKLLGD